MRPLALAALTLTARAALAQMDHSAHASSTSGATPGQAAYAAIADVVRALEADPNTDWSRVDIEALRRHLVDMDEVTLHSTAAARAVDGGLVVDGYGLGLSGRPPRAEPSWVVLAMVAVEAGASRRWLARFRLGPAGWGWRSLTCWRPEPHRLRPAEGAPVLAGSPSMS